MLCCWCQFLQLTQELMSISWTANVVVLLKYLCTVPIQVWEEVGRKAFSDPWNMYFLATSQTCLLYITGSSLPLEGLHTMHGEPMQLLLYLHKTWWSLLHPCVEELSNSIPHPPTVHWRWTGNEGLKNPIGKVNSVWNISSRWLSESTLNWWVFFPLWAFVIGF